MVSRERHGTSGLQAHRSSHRKPSGAAISRERRLHWHKARGHTRQAATASSRQHDQAAEPRYPDGSMPGGSQAWPLKRSRRASSLLMPHFAAVDR